MTKLQILFRVRVNQISNMHNDMTVKKIQGKFQELINLDENRRMNETHTSKSEHEFHKILSGVKKEINKKQEQKNLQKQRKSEHEGDELIFTKSDICRQVAKLKPYLRKFAETHTSVEMEDRANKRISDEEQNSLSELVIYLNRELCERLRAIEEMEGQKMTRRNKQKQGWVYEVSYRYAPNEEAAELSNKVFKNGYAVLTQVLELYPNLTFEQSLIEININEVKRIKYTEERQYQVIDIRLKDTTIHIGFLNDNQMQLFDRMLFLLKNMARTSSTRLFQNQLLKNIYSEY